MPKPSCGSRLPGCCGSKQFITTTFKRGSEGDPAARPRRRSAGRAATRIGPSLQRRHIPCRTKWSIRGTPHGNLAFTAFRSRSSIPILPKSSSSFFSANGTCTRTVNYPPDGLSEWPPVHAWAAWRVTKSSGACAASPIADSWKKVFHKLPPEFHLVGKPKGILTARYLSGWVSRRDNIGVFDRSAPLPQEATSNSPTHQLDGHVLPEHAGHRT